MSKKRRDFLLFLEDIMVCIEKLEKYTQGLTFDQFSKNEMAVDAVIRNFEVIGEAVKKIPKELKQKYPDVEWNEATGFRDVLIHDYFGIDLEAVWDTLKKNVPVFKEKLTRVLIYEKQTG
jgi:uncharacterized protein with HEPN domain